MLRLVVVARAPPTAWKGVAVSASVDGLEGRRCLFEVGSFQSVRVVGCLKPSAS